MGKQVYGLSENLLLHFSVIRLKKKKEPTSIAHPRGTTELHITTRTAELHKITTVLQSLEHRIPFHCFSHQLVAGAETKFNISL